MSLVNGVRSTNSLETGRRKFDVADKLWLVDPDYAVLAFFARRLAKKKVIDPEYRWFEKTQPSRTDAVNHVTAYTSGATTITVDNGNKFRAGDVVLDVTTSEHVYVQTVATNDLTIIRGWGTTSATTISDNEVLVILGNANAEGAAIRAALTNQAVKQTNYTQIFREPIHVTETEAATELYAEASDISQLRREHLQVHMKDIERSFLFGEAKEDLSTASTPIRSTAGARSFISTNITTSSTLTQTDFDTWMRQLFQNGGDKKMGFLAPLIGSAVDSWAKGKLFMYPTDKTYGIAVQSYLTVHGKMDFVIEKIFAENSTWAGMAFAFDMENVGYKYLAGNGINRDTRLLKDRQTAGNDEIKEEYLSEVGFWLALENRHGLLKGVTTYS